VGVPKANAASTTENHISAWESIAKSGASGWRFSISLNYGYIPSIAWSAYLQVAYLMVYILTGCHYAFTAAGRELRTLITQNKVGDLGACIIIPRTVDAVGVGGTPWLAEVTEPHGLRCLWVKLAGNVVILPLHDDSMLSCYKAWQDISEQNHFGLMPRNTHLRLVFRYLQNIAEAQQCLQPASQKSTRA